MLGGGVMINWYRIVCVVGFFAVASVGMAESGTSEHMPSEPLDKLWEQHMLEGKSSAVSVSVKGSTISVSESAPPQKSLVIRGVDRWKGLTVNLTA